MVVQIKKAESEFLCECGKYRILLVNGEKTKKKCPFCQKRYLGKLNEKTGKVEGILLNPMTIEKAEITLKEEGEKFLYKTGVELYRQARVVLWERDKEQKNGQV